MSGFDWNGNGRIDAGDKYIEYEIMNDEDSSSSGGSDGGGCGCLLLAFAGLMFLSLFW